MRKSRCGELRSLCYWWSQELSPGRSRMRALPSVPGCLGSWGLEPRWAGLAQGCHVGSAPGAG